MAKIETADIGKINPWTPENIDQTKELLLEYTALGTEIRTRLRPDVGKATVNLSEVNGAMRILVVSDLHAFHEASSLKKIDNVWNEINQPNTFVLFAGDLIEGIKQEYLGNTTSTLLPMQEQIDSFREIWLRPLAQTGKILGMVTRFGSHDDWPNDKTTINAYSSLTAGLTQPDGSPIPLIWNGGQLNLHFVESDLTFGVKLNHMVSGSGSTLNPVKPLREQIIINKIPRETSVPIAAVAGHQHTRAGVSSERIMAGSKEVQIVLCQNGTLKGVYPDHPDFFMQIKGLSTGPKLSGAAMVLRINEKKNGGSELQVIPTYGDTRSQYLLNAMDILNNTERQGITDELMQRIIEKNGPMTATFNKDQSRAPERVSGSPVRSPIYTEMHWDIDTGPLKLPLTVYTESHARFGTSKMYLEHTREINDQIAKSPYSGLLVLGDMVDLNVPGKSDREKTLKSFVKEIAKVPVDRRFGIMHSSVLQSDQWNKEIIERKCIVSKPVVTGDWLFTKSAVKGTPLYEGGAWMKMKVGNIDYWWYMLDGTGNFGSRQDPYLALVQLDKLSAVENDVVTGGISTIPGAFTNSRILLSPGWESPAVDRRHGKNFSQRVPKGGQGVVMFPEKVGNDKIIFGGGSFRETRDIGQALTLWRGLDSLGELQSVMTRK